MALLSCPCLGLHLLAFMTDGTRSMVEAGGDTSASLSPSGSTTALENFEYPWDVPGSVFLLLCLLNMFRVSFRVQRLFKKSSQRCAVRLDSHGWHGTWESMGRYLENFPPPMVWDFTPERLQDPDKAVEY